MWLTVWVPVFCLVVGCTGESLVGPVNTFVGCYKADTILLVFRPNYIHDQPISVGDCLALCKYKGYHFVLKFQTSPKCNCIDMDPILEQRVADQECPLCTSTGRWKCGGNDTMAIYYAEEEDILEDLLLAFDVKEVNQGLELMNRLSLNEISVAQFHGTPITAIDYHLQGRNAFVAWKNEIHRFPLAGGKGDKSNQSDSWVTNLDSDCPTFTVDWVHNRTFWPICSSKDFSGIRMVDLDGSNKDTLVEVHENITVKGIVVDPYRGLLFWSTSNQTVMSVGLDGNNLRTVTVGTSLEHGLSLDMVAERVYFSPTYNGISYIHYNGSDVHTRPLAPITYDVVGFGVFRSEVYVMSRSLHFITHLSTTCSSGCFNTKLVYSRPNKTYTHVKMVHSMMQSRPRNDDCTYITCSHHCVVEASVARCQCPQGYVLRDDEETCERLLSKFISVEDQERNGSQHSDFFMNIIAGTACVIFVIFAALGLMSLVDRFWSRINPTVVRITPYIFKPPIIYRRSQDDVNLI